MSNFLWKIKANPPQKNLKDLLKILAKNRDLATPQKLNNFLNPKIEQILDIKLTDLEKGAVRVIKALKNKEKIIVYSDYDADGLCGTAILWEVLNDLGGNVLPYVPHRVKEGYGLSTPAISKLAEKGIDLIITVDHGVNAAEQINYAKNLGIDVVITDHHLLPKKLPQLAALVHTVELSGAGVAWRFCWEIVKRLKPTYQEVLLEKLDLASVATIADLVPLIGGNRAVVKLGLAQLAKTSRLGLKALIKTAGITGPIGSYEIGHILAPRINAMGRIEHGLDSLRLLCTQDQKRAQELSQLLSKTNSRRQDLAVKAVTQAMEMAAEDDLLVGVITHEDWHEGIIGLVANRLVETFHKPMVVIAKGETFSKGSARSIPGFNIVEAIRSSSEFLIDGGGHPMAAGFTIETRHIEIFKEKINEYASMQITEEILTPQLAIECELDKEMITEKTLATIKQFEPFGVGNPEPVFLTRNMLVEDVRCVGAGSQHLKLQVDGFSAIGFNLGELRTNLRPGFLADLVYTLTEDKFNDQEQLQLKIADLAITSSNQNK